MEANNVMSDEHKTTADLEAHVATVEERCVEAINGFSKQLGDIETKFDDHKGSTDGKIAEVMKLSHQAALEMVDLRAMAKASILVTDRHEDELKEASETRKFFGQKAVTTIIALFMLGITAIVTYFTSAKG